MVFIENPERLTDLMWFTQPHDTKRHLVDMYQQGDGTYTTAVIDNLEAHPYRAENPEYLLMYRRIIEQAAEYGFPECSAHLQRYLRKGRERGYKLDFMHPRHLLELSNYMGNINIQMGARREDLLDQGVNYRDVFTRWVRPKDGVVPSIETSLTPRRGAPNQEPIVIMDPRFNRAVASLGLNPQNVERMSEEEFMGIVIPRADGLQAFGSVGISIGSIYARELQQAS